MFSIAKQLRTYVHGVNCVELDFCDVFKSKYLHLIPFSVSQITLQDPFHGTIQGLLHATNYKLLFKEDPSNVSCNAVMEL